MINRCTPLVLAVKPLLLYSVCYRAFILKIMTESDRKYYEAREREDAKRAKALSKAAYRGEKSVEWHKTNQLTAATLPDFKKAMKQADKEWDSLNAL